MLWGRTWTRALRSWERPSALGIMTGLEHGLGGAIAQGQADVDPSDGNGGLDERADDPGECLAGGDTEFTVGRPFRHR